VTGVIGHEFFPSNYNFFALVPSTGLVFSPKKEVALFALPSYGTVYLSEKKRKQKQKPATSF
jgi:hypothetical protein